MSCLTGLKFVLVFLFLFDISLHFYYMAKPIDIHVAKNNTIYIFTHANTQPHRIEKTHIHSEFSQSIIIFPSSTENVIMQQITLPI